MNDVTRLITVRDTKYIEPLRIFGPVLFPKHFSEALVYKLVQRGYDVVEHATANTPGAEVKTVKLTITNFYNKDRFKSISTNETANNDKVVAIVGKPAVGAATVINKVLASDPVNVPEVKTEAVETEKPTTPPVATPINTTMSKAERKRLAREAREKEAAERAAAEAATKAESETVPEVVEEKEEPTETTETTEA